MKKYICLRDDDTSFYIAANDFKTCYGEFWGVLPITLATIPFIHGSSNKIVQVKGFLTEERIVSLRKWELEASADELSEYHKICPVGDNKELVVELKKQIEAGKVEIAQHGVNHSYSTEGPEMQSTNRGFISIRYGKEYLEKVFGVKINIFIPPSNTIDRGCIKSIDKLGMKLFTCGSVYWHGTADMIKAYLLDPMSIIDKFKLVLHKKKTPLLRRAGIYMFGGCTYNSFDEYNTFKSQIIRNLDNTGFCALVTHITLLKKNDDYRKLYLKLLSELSDLKDVEFVTASEYYKLLLNK